MSVPAKMDTRARVVDFFQKRGLLIQPEAVDFIASLGGVEICKEVLRELGERPFIITVEMVRKIFEKRTPPPPPAPRVIKFEEGSKKEEGKGGLRVIRDVTGNSTCEGKIDDFVNLFRDRFDRVSALLRKRQEMRYAMPIKRAKRMDGDVSTIGMVRDVSPSKNGLFIDIEDYDDSIKVYVPKNVDPMVLNDEVIGVVGRRRGDVLFATSIVRPEISLERKRNFASEEFYVVFLSDLHVGSKNFLEEEWNGFIKWIGGKNGNERQKEVAKKVRYIVISGDDIDGVGIYPGQEDDLSIEDVYQQYEVLAEKLKDIPEEIGIIMQPGNHDAVRPALPQPSFEREIKDIFSSLNISFVGNPCYMELDGVVVLSYHGQSIQDFATYLPGMNQNQPAEIMKEMLRRRHMAPIYGGVSSLAPEKQDYMVIDVIPDVFVTGHVHVTAVETYRNVLLINASAWQSQTEYQKMMNFMPDPAKAVIVNFGNLIPSAIHFA